jgi:hypothetical protein
VRDRVPSWRAQSGCRHLSSQTFCSGDGWIQEGCA